MKLKSICIMATILWSICFPGRAMAFEPKEVTAESQINAAHGVIQRTTPSIAGSFTLEIIEKENGLDVFELESALDGKIILRGSTGVALCSAYNWYLKYYCNCHVSWCGNQLNLPGKLPKIESKVRRKTLDEYRVYLNYCVFSYSMPWWDWSRWRREVDWMALNGINMPLAVTGLEGTWYHTLQEFDLSDEEIRGFLTSPSHMAWQWMTNIQGNGKDLLPKHWINSHIELGQQIIEAERALGMMPIQQGFTGYVPHEMKEQFPEANIKVERPWIGSPGTCQLDPLDPLFEKVAGVFYQKQKDLFGSSGYYGADPFHEGRPPVSGKKYLRSVGKTVLKAMQNADPDAMWLMQSWSFLPGIAEAVPKGKLLVLDLDTRRGKYLECDEFFGHEFVVGTINNFGGRTRIHGDLGYLADHPGMLWKERGEQNAGMGLFMEGIEGYPVFYELNTEMIWHDKPVDLNEWVKSYAQRRYGAKDASAEKAWEIMSTTGPYLRGSEDREASSMLAARPSLYNIKSGPNRGFEIEYQNKDLGKAWELLLENADTMKHSAAYQYDVVDIGRQVLSDLARDMYPSMVETFVKGDKEMFLEKKAVFLEIFDDVDRLIGSQDLFLLGRWIEQAKSWGQTPDEEEYYRKYATELVTHWGPSVGVDKIFDYSWREWNGLVGSYYKGRWEIFLGHLEDCLDKGIKYDDSKVKSKYKRPLIAANEIFTRMYDWEKQWIATDHSFPSKPQGNSVGIAQELQSKYASLVAESVSNVSVEKEALNDNFGEPEKK
jgi:alpha-N-acetylglucosaminidase